MATERAARAVPSNMWRPVPYDRDATLHGLNLPRREPERTPSPAGTPAWTALSDQLPRWHAALPGRDGKMITRLRPGSRRRTAAGTRGIESRHPVWFGAAGRGEVARVEPTRDATYRQEDCLQARQRGGMVLDYWR